MPKTNTIADLDVLRLRVAELDAALGEERTRAEAAECTLRAVCKALGADVDSAEAQAAAFREMADRGEAYLRGISTPRVFELKLAALSQQVESLSDGGSPISRVLVDAIVENIRDTMRKLGLWRGEPAAQEARE